MDKEQEERLIKAIEKIAENTKDLANINQNLDQIITTMTILFD